MGRLHTGHRPRGCGFEKQDERPPTSGEAALRACEQALDAHRDEQFAEALEAAQEPLAAAHASLRQWSPAPVPLCAATAKGGRGRRARSAATDRASGRVFRPGRRGGTGVDDEAHSDPATGGRALRDQ